MAQGGLTHGEEEERFLRPFSQLERPGTNRVTAVTRGFLECAQLKGGRQGLSWESTHNILGKDFTARQKAWLLVFTTNFTIKYIQKLLW